MCWRDTFRRSILGPMATFWMPKAGRLNRREGQGHIGHSTLIALIISYARDGGFKNLYLCTTCWVSKVFFSVPLFCCRCSENKTLLRAWAGDVAINSSNPRATRCAGLSLTDTTGIWKDLDISHHFSSNSFEDAGLLSAVEVRSLDSFDPPTRPLQFLLEERTLGVEFVLLTISICVASIQFDCMFMTFILNALIINLVLLIFHYSLKVMSVMPTCDCLAVSDCHRKSCFP